MIGSANNTRNPERGRSMDTLTAAQHRRRQIIFGVVLTILIPIVNQILSRWGLPSIPTYVAPPPATTSSSGVLSGSRGVDADGRSFSDQVSRGNLIPCGVRGFNDGEIGTRPRLQFRRPLRFHRRETRRSPHLKNNPTIPVESPACTLFERTVKWSKCPHRCYRWMPPARSEKQQSSANGRDATTSAVT
jgi:hypothetical protein